MKAKIVILTPVYNDWKNLAKLLNEVLSLFGTDHAATKITDVASLFNSQETNITEIEIQAYSKFSSIFVLF